MLGPYTYEKCESKQPMEGWYGDVWMEEDQKVTFWYTKGQKEKYLEVLNLPSGETTWYTEVPIKK